MFLGLLTLTAAATAHAGSLDGTVVESHSHWGYQGTAIVTESVIESASGERRTVHQLGGSVDGIGQIMWHAPPVLHRGDVVLVETESVAAPSGRHLELLRQVLDLRRPEAAVGERLSPGGEFVRTLNNNGAPIFWRSGCAFVSAASDGSSQIAGDAEFQVIGETMQRWREETSGCSYFVLENDGRADREVGFDGINIIKFREQQWCRPASDDEPQKCYDQAAVGLTTLTFIDDSGSSRNGEILDADIELNGVNYAFSVDGQTLGQQNCDADLANTLTHELGHFMGLDHTCWTGGRRLVDGDGNPVPACDGPGIDGTITEATMYNFQACGETKKSSPEADDIAGICTIYPLADDPQECERPNIDPGGCCSVASSRNAPESSWWGALLLALAAALPFLRLRRATSLRE
jgi:hypothetical protein